MIVCSDNSAQSFSELGKAYLAAGRRTEAIELFRKAIAVDARFMPAYNNLALALIEGGDHANALPIAERGLAIDPSYIPLYAVLLLAVKYLGRAEEAIPYLRRAVVIKGDDPQLLSNLGSLLAESGETVEALQIFEKVVAFDPPYIPAYHMLSLIKKFEHRDDTVTAMERLLTQKTLPLQDKATLHYALGKAYEDLKIYDVSFQHYKAANDVSRETFQYDIAEDREFFAQIKQTFTADFIRSHQAQACKQTPIFIVGMPRSGTSLVEQMLASHSDLYAAGELNTLDWLQFGYLGMTKSAYAEAMGKMTTTDFQNFSQMYLERLNKGAIGKAFFTDKMPLNFRYIGLIKCLFPNAKIIHCTRDPIDTCFSMYKTKFVGHFPFKHTQRELAQYYKLYRDLMAYWHSVLPDDIVDCAYEDVVMSSQKTIRRVFDFCGLPWTDESLKFYENKRPVTTASTLQVRQPIYQSAVGSWRRYEEFLGELIIACSVYYAFPPRMR